MKEKDFYEEKELEQDMEDIDKALELLRGYDNLIQKYKELKENEG